MILDQVATLGDTTWTTPGWPAAVGGVGVLGALGLVVASLVAPGSGGGRPWIAVGVGVAGIFAGLCALFAPVLVALAQPRGWTTGDAFGALLVAEALCGAAAVVLLGLAAAVWLARAPGGDPPWIRLGLAVPALSAALFTLGHAVWLLGVGPLPELVADLPARVHVGRALDLEVSLLGANVLGWEAPPVRIMAAAPGPVTVPLTTRRFGVSGTRVVTTEAGEDRFDPAVALAVGHAWTFVETTSWRSQYLWVLPSREQVTGERTTVRVTGTREVPGLRVYDVAVEGEGSASTLAVYAWNGAVMVLPAEGEPYPFLALQEGAAEDGTVPCSYAPFPSAGCACYRTAPGGPVSLPGPVRCSWTSGSAISTGVSAFLAVVTLGLVLEDPDRSHVVDLVSSGPTRPDGRKGASSLPNP